MGRPRLGALGVGALAASACLPTIFRSIDVDGHFFWDGGYLGNPALSPLRNPALAPDLLIVRVNPLIQPNVPINARDILDRLSEMSFNATLVQEIEAIDAINELRSSANAPGSPYMRIRLQEIRDEPHLAGLGRGSKGNTGRDFLLELRDFGRQTAKRWRTTSLGVVGRNTTADMHRVLRCLESR